MFPKLRGAVCAAVALAAGTFAGPVAGAEIGIDQENKVVTVGAFTPVTGPVPFYAILTHAADAYYKNLNENGGIDGWTVNYVTKDDGYDPARSVAVTRQMVEDDGIFALSAPIGTATNVAVLPYAREVGLPVVGPIGGASAFFVEPTVFPLLPDYGWSAASNLDYAISDLGLTKVALLWENDELGKSAQRGVDAYMAKAGKELAESVPFDVKTTNFSPHIRRVANSGAEAVILFGSNANLAAALKAADLQGLDVKWFAPFFTADPSTRKLTGGLLDGVYFSSWLLPVSSDEPEIAAYRDAMAKYYPDDPVGVFGLNGWSNAAIFHKGFEALLASGKELTRENLVAALETLDGAAVGGARGVTFKPGDHRGTRQEGIIQATADGFELVQEFRPYPAVVFDASKSQ
ncbi:branched-chain amino acid transport system substrate-binding protein [Rhodobium orientis]|uniref:ABC transporter substrate-binding protein n=1 Tax=Rhodobium orientis TaxID=34017 RepID=A0A327JKL3_9HYPH|nr:ABC transporter substrate-binding protein [Rhodobium orientis]MBB4303250.1 branched-chain amino acid transport system substrate-binding protein [Rhodobium orientis]MBK5951650.1 ABC transporter substrate-binding protein [Rhodobium orientis]RAI25874.1 ABC transporter substrate-binding protein [Rhodobium orientis]